MVERATDRVSSKDREAGAALVLALAAVALILTSVLLVSKLIDARQIADNYEKRSIILTALSDAAFAETLASLSKESTFAGVGIRAFHQGEISSTVSTSPLGGKRVVAVGDYGGWQSVIVAEVHLDPGTGRPRVMRYRRTQSSK